MFALKVWYNGNFEDLIRWHPNISSIVLNPTKKVNKTMGGSLRCILFDDITQFKDFFAPKYLEFKILVENVGIPSSLH